MTRSVRTLILLVMLFSAVIAQPVSSESPGHAKRKSTFVASNGNLIELDIRAGILVTPRSRSAHLENCSDRSQVCLTDHHGFAFAYFRKCNDAMAGDYKRLRFRPNVVSVLHNSDVWMVFDAGPKYLFHYAYDRGIVGIYLGPTSSYDFRKVLHDPNFRLSDLDPMEYRITASSSAIAACSE